MPAVTDPALLAQLNGAGGPRIVASTPPLPKAPAGYHPGPTLAVDQGYLRGQTQIAGATASASAAAQAAKEKQIIDYRNAAERSQTQAINKINQGSMGEGFNRAEKLRDDFRQTKAAQDYPTVLPMVTSAMRAPPGAAGDLATIYAFGKVMDPGSAVREGELNLAQQTAPMSAWLDRMAQRVQSGNLLRPEERKKLIEAMRVRASEYGSAYSQARFRFAKMARDAGLDPTDIIGEHAGIPFQGAEANFLGRPIHNRDGTQGAKPSQPAKPASNFTRGKDGVLEWHP